MVRVIGNCNAEYRDALGSVSAMQLLELIELLTTPPAGARPEVQQHHLAAILTEPEITAARAAQCKIRRRLIDSRRGSLLLDTDQAFLSLVTCYPFDAREAGGPLRYVVTARKVR